MQNIIYSDISSASQDETEKYAFKLLKNNILYHLFSNEQVSVDSEATLPCKMNQRKRLIFIKITSKYYINFSIPLSEKAKSIEAFNNGEDYKYFGKLLGINENFWGYFF